MAESKRSTEPADFGELAAAYLRDPFRSLHSETRTSAGYRNAGAKAIGYTDFFGSRQDLVRTDLCSEQDFPAGMRRRSSGRRFCSLEQEWSVVGEWCIEKVPQAKGGGYLIRFWHAGHSPEDVVARHQQAVRAARKVAQRDDPFSRFLGGISRPRFNLELRAEVADLYRSGGPQCGHSS